MRPLSSPAAIRDKARPSLAAVIGFVLALVMVLPLAGMTAVVVLSRQPDVLLDRVIANLDRILVAGMLVAAATALVGYVFWRLIARPVRELMAWTEQVATGREFPSIPQTRFGTRELARLASSFASMVDRLEERGDYIAGFAAHVSHELKSPLTSIAGAAELLREAEGEIAPQDRARFLRNIERDALRLSELVARMRDLARAETARAAGKTSLEELAASLRERFDSLRIDVRADSDLLPLPVDDALAVLTHLAENAAVHGARLLTIEMLRRRTGVALTVCNDGAPISPGNRAMIFEPFYTTRREEGGTGMGLAIVRAILKAHGGWIGLDPAAEPGPRFRILLPDPHTDTADQASCSQMIAFN